MKTLDKYSNCCGALMESPWDDIERCHNCKENCVAEEGEDYPKEIEAKDMEEYFNKKLIN